MNATNLIPIIPLWGVLLVPLQGEITDTQAAHLSEAVLQRISRSGADGLVFDVSGVAIIDSHLCAILARVASAAQLMGAPTTICGVKPEIAMTLQAMGVRFEVNTTLTLEEALRDLGIQKVGAADGFDEADELMSLMLQENG